MKRLATIVFCICVSLGAQTKLELSSQVKGTLPIANGGTGQTTQQAAIDALVPSQSGNSGKCLGTDATNVSWVTCGSGGSVSVQVGGSAVATESTTDFQPGTGIQISGTNPTGKAQVTIGNDTSVMQTKAAAQAGAELVCAPASGTNTLTCSMTPTLSSYATGMTVKLVPPANNTTAVTLDIDTIGAVAVETSGSVALSANDLVAGEAVLLTYNGTEFRFIGPAPGEITPPAFEKAITVESPTSSEDISLWRTPYAITVTRLYCVNVGSTPSVTYTIRHGSDRSATGNEVVTSGSTTTSTTTGDSVTSFNDATIPANSFIWFETTAQSGTVTSTNCTIEYTKDPA